MKIEKFLVDLGGGQKKRVLEVRTLTVADQSKKQALSTFLLWLGENDHIFRGSEAPSSIKIQFSRSEGCWIAVIESILD